MSTLRECQVIMLPSKDSSHIVINNYLNVRHGKKAIQYLTELIPTVEQAEDRGYTPQHLYVVSDDEIKEGDWYYWSVTKTFGQYKKETQIREPRETDSNTRFKIIATTDTALWLHDDTVPYPKTKSLPSLSTGFIKKYCELRGIDKILVEYEGVTYTNNAFRDMEHKKSFLRPITRPDNTIITHPVKTEWSREEVIELIERAVGESHDWSQENNDIHSIGIINKRFLDNWIKQNL